MITIFSICDFIFSRFDAKWLNCGIKYSCKIKKIYSLYKYIPPFILPKSKSITETGLKSYNRIKHIYF